MEQTREDEAQKAASQQREWMVEYEVTDEDGVKLKHLSVLYGKNITDVQASLFVELRELYPQQTMIEVTITRFEPVSTQANRENMNYSTDFTA